MGNHIFHTMNSSIPVCLMNLENESKHLKRLLRVIFKIHQVIKYLQDTYQIAFNIVVVLGFLLQ